MIHLKLPFTKEEALALHAGDAVFLSGTIYTARDAAHKRLVELIHAGAPLPFPLKGAVIYYAGPCPPKPGQVMNSCGPTTSGRMDRYAPELYALGAAGAIGKGKLGAEVRRAMGEAGAVYFIATGGAGALISRCVTEAEVVAFPELGAEAIRRIEVRDMPVIVGIDTRGEDIYETGRQKYAVNREG